MPEGLQALLTFVARLHEGPPIVGQAGTFQWWDRKIPCTVVKVCTRRVVVVRIDGSGQEIKVTRRVRRDGSLVWKRVGVKTRSKGFTAKF